ncbi:hypothetical protein PhCBS80983_g05815 [Powellomyces hirtus]|uniref:ABC transporter domain-containing protein n=1 Tax=Powellomyces hirtus TaxID=109895 RepID=A0A507DT48_9FUNG|nr:hypothetical protein PhCBS80983_g05815 [Powellomyces hirtus]
MENMKVFGKAEDYANVDVPLIVTDGKPSSLPKHVLAWRDLSFSVPAKGAGSGADAPRTILLDNVSGFVQSGEMLAVMGPSGAGKSTFLDTLSGRRRGEQYRGSVRLDGTTEFPIRHLSSYVEQDDALFGSLTVSETLYYAARLSLPSSLSYGDVEQRINETLAQLGLSRVADNLIGTPIQRGISGGQKRRVTIGSALITKPVILFLDEPTSGLDSDTTFHVMSSLKNLAKTQNVIIIATIHQPNYDTFSLFDRLLLLARGKTLYCGPVADLPTYCETIYHPIPGFRNPADHVMSIVNPDFVGSAEQADQQISLLVKAWAPKQAELVTDLERREKEANSFRVEATAGDQASMVRKTGYLVARMMLNYRRSLIGYGVRLGMYIGMGLLLALVWINLGTEQEKLNDRISVHFFSVAFLGFMSVAGIPAFLEERGVYLRERHNGLYGPAAYALANSVVTIPFLLICNLAFCLICYWAIGLAPGAGHFFQFFIYLFLALYAAESQSVLIAALIPIFIAALAIAAFANGFWMVVQGYFMRNLPSFWQNSFHYMDFQMYSFQLLMNEDLRGTIWTCGNAPTGACQCNYYSELQEAGICAFRGEDALKALDIYDINYGKWIVILVSISLVLRLAFYAVLKLKH